MHILTLYFVHRSSKGKKNAPAGKYTFTISPLCGRRIFLSNDVVIFSLPQGKLADGLNSGYLSQIFILCFLKGFCI